MSKHRVGVILPGLLFGLTLPCNLSSCLVSVKGNQSPTYNLINAVYNYLLQSHRLYLSSLIQSLPALYVNWERKVCCAFCGEEPGVFMRCQGHHISFCMINSPPAHLLCINEILYLCNIAQNPAPSIGAHLATTHVQQASEARER